MKRFVTLAAIAGLVLPLAACGSKGDAGAGAGAGHAPRIAFLAGVVDATYTPAQVSGLESGSGGKVTTFNPQFDPATQLHQCQDAIASQRYDAIVISPLDNSSSIPCARAARGAHIPLIVDGTAIGKDVNSFAPQADGVDFSAIWVPSTDAEYTWDGIKQACGSDTDCQVVIEISFAGDPLFDAIVSYVKKESAGTGIHLVATYESHYDPAETTAKLNDILVAHPGVNVVTFANDPTALAGAEVVKKLKKQSQIKLIGSGGTKAAVAAIGSGSLYSTIAVLPKTGAEMEGKMALKAIDGDKIAPQGVDAFLLGQIHGVISKDNVGQFTPEW